MDRELKNKVDKLMVELEGIKGDYLKRIDNDGYGSEGFCCDEGFENIDMIIDLVKKHMCSSI